MALLSRKLPKRPPWKMRGVPSPGVISRTLATTIRWSPATICVFGRLVEVWVTLNVYGGLPVWGRS